MIAQVQSTNPLFNKYAVTEERGMMRGGLSLGLSIQEFWNVALKASAISTVITL